MSYENIIPSVEYFVDRKCWPSWNVTKAKIDFHDLTYIYSGKAVYIVNDTEYQLSRNDFIYIPKGSIRQAYTFEEDPMHCYAFNFHLDFYRGEEVSLPFPTVFTVGRLSELTEYYKCFNNVWMQKDPEYLLEARAIFMLILHKLITLAQNVGTSQKSHSITTEIKEYIMSHLNQKIEIPEMADIFGLHPVYFGALFKKNSGYTIKEYITMLRINNAENLLSTGGYTVSEAAFRCGFEDIFYFSKVFKKYKGVTPSSIINYTMQKL
jgi:AraC family transcriptional regulator, arabinose operon regulatory protein